MVKIYAIANPATDEVIYIGASINPIERYRCHISGKSWHPVTYKAKVIQQMIDAGIMPELIIIDEVPIDKIKFFEEFYISLFKSWGYKLTQMLQSGYSVKYRKRNKPKMKNVAITEEAYFNMRTVHDGRLTFDCYWISDAINEKVQRETNGNGNPILERHLNQQV